MSLPAKKVSSLPLSPLAPFDASRIPTAPQGTDGGGPFAAGYPKAFGPYALLKSFAHGGMGQVFLAQSGGLQGLEKLCVVKKLRADLTENREYVRRFLDEARVVVQLNHANICHVFDVGCVGHEYYLAMEHVAGLNLRALFHRAREKNLPVTESIALFALREVLEALDYAHRLEHPLTGQSLRLVHRDVSPQNVMLSYEGETKLIDFGLAASDLKEEHTQGDVVMGKVAYMSPEQARGEDIGAQTDQFAAAVVAYELLVGERYYGDLTTHQIWQVVGTGKFRPPAWERLPRKLQTILARALAPQPDERFATCGDFSEELQGYLNAKSLTPSKRRTRAYIHELFAAEIERERKQLASWMQHLRTLPTGAHKTTDNPSLIETAPQAPAGPSSNAKEVVALFAPHATKSEPKSISRKESTQRFEALSLQDRAVAQRPIALAELDPQFENSSTLALVQMVMGPSWKARYSLGVAGILVLGFCVFAGAHFYPPNAETDTEDTILEASTSPVDVEPPAESVSTPPLLEASSAPLVVPELEAKAAKSARPAKTPKPPASSGHASEVAASSAMSAARADVDAPPLRSPQHKVTDGTVQENPDLSRQRWRDRVVKRLSACPASCAQTLLGSSSALSTGHPLDVNERDFQAISFTVERCLRSCEK